MRDVDLWLEERISLLERHKIAEEEYNREYAHWQNLCASLQLAENTHANFLVLQTKYQTLSGHLQTILALTVDIAQQYRVDPLTLSPPQRMWMQQIEDIQRSQMEINAEMRRLDSGVEIYTYFEKSRVQLEDIEQNLEFLGIVLFRNELKQDTSGGMFGMNSR